MDAPSRCPLYSSSIRDHEEELQPEEDVTTVLLAGDRGWATCVGVRGERQRWRGSSGGHRDGAPPPASQGWLPRGARAKGGHVHASPRWREAIRGGAAGGCAGDDKGKVGRSMHLFAGERRAAAVLQVAVQDHCKKKVAVQETIEARSGGGGGTHVRWVAAAPSGELDVAWKEREVRRGGGC